MYILPREKGMHLNNTWKRPVLDKDLAKQLRKAGEGMTQIELAKASGISQTSITAIEKGHKEPRASTICALCNALKCSPVMF